MSGRWFRFYDGTLDDPKVQKLPLDLFKLWVNLLCVASRNDGAIPQVEDLAFCVRMSEKQLRKGMEKLCEAGLLDQLEDCLSPHNWDSRQYKSDTSNDRVKQFRERNKKQPKVVTCNDDVTLHETPPEQIQSRADTEQISPSPRSGVKSKPEPDGFEAFYEAFPKHVGRGQALKAYRSALKIATGEALLTGARRYAASVVGKEPQFVAHPATWLNGQRWLDELSAAGPDNVVAIDWAAFNTPEERDAQERRKQASG